VAGDVAGWRRLYQDRGLLASYGWLGMQQQALAVRIAAAVSHLAADGVDEVAVQRPFALVRANRMQAAALFSHEECH
jgi:hypothetical protein